MTPQIRINHHIRATEVRLINAAGENVGVVPLTQALTEAKNAGLDLIEISGMVNPPIVKIAEYGKFLYEKNKKEKQAKANAHVTETKSLQVKIATGDHDLALKAKKASEWLAEGHRIKLDLFLSGRSKYMNETFLKERLERILRLITENFKVAQGPVRSPKGLTVVLEKSK